MIRSLFSVIYTIIGVVVAINLGYGTIISISTLLSFALAVMLWPALLFGLSVHLHLGF
jgi:hypothetical protein